MKRLLLPLILVSPILAALAPHADAAAITFDSSVLRPQLLGPASFPQRNRAGVPGSVFKMPAAPKMSNAINNSLLFGSTLQVGGGVVKTGAATLTLDGTNAYSGGTLITRGTGLSVRDTGFLSGSLTAERATLDPGSARLWLGGIGSGRLTIGGTTIDTNGFGVRINAANVIADTTTLADGLLGVVLTKDGVGALTIGDILTVNVSSGTLNFGSNQTLDNLVIDAGGTISLNSLGSLPLAPTGAGSVTIAPAPPQIPEPGTAVLFAIGMLAASQVRRRRAV